MGAKSKGWLPAGGNESAPCAHPSSRQILGWINLLAGRDKLKSVALLLSMRERPVDFRPPNLSFPQPGRHRWRIRSARVCPLVTKLQSKRESAPRDWIG